MLPIRRLLLRDLLVLMAGLSALILGFSWWSQQLALKRQASARTASALHHLQTVLHLELKASQSLGEVARGWWLNGTLDPARPEEAGRLLLPLLAAQRSITSLNLARQDGPSLLFLRRGDDWFMRELLEPGPQARIRWHRLGRPGDRVTTEAWAPMAYDPRTRPWYLAGAGGTEPSWTEPYTFYTTKDPGITCTFPVRDARGLVGVAALDFLLDDLTASVWSAQPTPRSRCLVVDREGRALILPNDPAFQTPEARRRAFLNPVGTGFLEAQSGLLKAPLGRAQSFRFRDDAMIGLITSFASLPGIHWRLLMTVPEEDLLGPARLRLWTLFGMAILSLGLAAWRILHIARRVAGPITQLGAAAEALGQGATPPPIHSRILEIRSLDRALRQASDSLIDQARLQRQLEHSQRMETVGTLAGGIAHDVNNQLAAILGQLHLCRETLPEGHSALNRIQRAEEATRRCAQTTKALLSFSHQSRPELQPLDLNALVQDTAAVLEPLLGGRIRLQCHLAPDLPPIAGDPVQLEQVIMNLGVNARDAMPEGGRLSLSTGLGEDGQVLLDVQDTGSGIPEALLPRLFEPFVTTKEHGKGTGLGLVMVFSILKAHGGTVQAENRPEGGARFRVSLPPADGSAVPAAQGPRRLQAASPRLAGRRILVVEDEPLLREMLADALTLARTQVTAAPDGALAWKAWQQAGGFDLVISDQRMPDCTGLELMDFIRGSGSDVPFILVSGQGLESVEDRLSADPRVRFLPKPFELPKLLPIMEEMLGPRRD
ncbi:MAG: ATP-binding protein [Holophagaceae bacterium]